MTWNQVARWERWQEAPPDSPQCSRDAKEVPERRKKKTRRGKRGAGRQARRLTRARLTLLGKSSGLASSSHPPIAAVRTSRLARIGRIPDRDVPQGGSEVGTIAESLPPPREETFRSGVTRLQRGEGVSRQMLRGDQPAEPIDFTGVDRQNRFAHWAGETRRRNEVASQSVNVSLPPAPEGRVWEQNVAADGEPIWRLVRTHSQPIRGLPVTRASFLHPTTGMIRSRPGRRGRPRGGS